MTDALTTTPARYLAAAADGHLGRMIEGRELVGFKAFFGPGRMRGVVPDATDDWWNGWWLAHRLCYAQGALASFADKRTDGQGVDDVQNPYPQPSSAWEAWADGYTDEGAGALG